MSHFYIQSQEIIKLGHKYFPSITSSLDDDKVKVHIGDGNEFMKKQKNAFDVIINRSTREGWDLSFNDVVEGLQLLNMNCLLL